MAGTGISIPHSTIGLVVVTLGLITLSRLGILGDTATLTAAASAALLIFGLPHGTFDLALLRRAGMARQHAGSTDTARQRAGSTDTASTLKLVLLYLGCAAAMYLVWQLAPVVALAGFLVIAALHFAEDWQASGSRFVSTGIATAMLCAPSLLHGHSLRNLFGVVAGTPSAGALADVLLLLAPVGIAVALVGMAMLWQAGRRDLAVAAACALAAMVILPPVQGFAVFFCLVHSPMQFRAHASMLGWHGFRAWRGAVMPLSLAGLAIAGAVVAAAWPSSIAARIFVGSFVTLSILTVPHMLVPLIATRLARP